MDHIIRKTVFAGRFYPGNKDELEKLLNFIDKTEAKRLNLNAASKHILGGIVPHAGYIYSGYHASHFYQLVKNSTEKFDTIVIINPNHTGKGIGAFNIPHSEVWETPLGNILIDTEFGMLLDIENSERAHEDEHSGEVQLPLLKYYLPYEFKIVPITMNIQSPEKARTLALKIAHASEVEQKNILVIASSDFSHYESPTSGFKKDQYLIDEILKFNINEAYNQVKKHEITACGYGSIMTLMAYAQIVSKKPQFQLLRRGHSGEVSHSERVVDYASFVCFE